MKVYIKYLEGYQIKIISSQNIKLKQFQGSKKMYGLVVSIDKVNQTTKEYATIIIDNFKKKLDRQIDKLGVDNWETAYDIMKESLKTQNIEDSLKKIEDIVKERSKRLYGPKNIEDFLNFARYVMRMLRLPDYEPDHLCALSLKQFQDAFTIKYFGPLSKDGNRFEVSEKGRQEILKYVSEELQVYVQEKVLEFETFGQTEEDFLEQIKSQITSIPTSNQNSVTITKIDPQFVLLDCESNDENNCTNHCEDPMTLQQEEERMKIEFGINMLILLFISIDSDITDVQVEKI